MSPHFMWGDINFTFHCEMNNPSYSSLVSQCFCQSYTTVLGDPLHDYIQLVNLFRIVNKVHKVLNKKPIHLQSSNLHLNLVAHKFSALWPKRIDLSTARPPVLVFIIYASLALILIII